jgi:hypothetical protein
VDAIHGAIQPRGGFPDARPIASLFVGFPHMAVTLGIGAAVPDEFIAARLERVDDARRIVEHRRVDQVGRRKVQLIEQIEATPHADPVAVVPPGESPGIWRSACDGQEMSFTRAECEMFDVEAKINRQPFSVRPGIVRAVDDRRVSIAIMIGKLHVGFPAKLRSALDRIPWRQS